MKRQATIPILLALAVAALAALAAGDAAATHAIAKRENLQCTACHDKPGSKLLTDRGLYYEVTGSLEGYRRLEGAFGRCTTCHERAPGSGKLTAVGDKLTGVVEDMEELQEWVLESHPEEIRRAIEAAKGEPKLLDLPPPEVELESEVPEPPPADDGG